MRYEMLKETYVDKFETKILTEYGMDAEDVWEYYHKNIYPFLTIISKERKLETPPKEIEIQYALYVTKPLWRACKNTFVGLRQALAGEGASMKFKAQVDLQREVYNNPNAKYIEMQMKRYDDEYNVKGQEAVIELPKTLQVVVEDKRMSDEELEDFE